MQAQLDKIAGDGGIVLPNGTVAPVPGAAANRFGSAYATSSGTAAGDLPYKEAGQANQAGLDENVASFRANLDRDTNADKAASDAQYRTVTFTAKGIDGQYHEFTQPASEVPGMDGGRKPIPELFGATTLPNDAPIPSPGASSVMPATQWANRIQRYENGTGNPATGNTSGPGGTPTSSAVGNSQFTQGTFVPLFRRSYPQQAAGMSDNDILPLRADPQISQDLTVRYAQENAPILSGAGVTPTGATLALAHRFGPGGAIAVERAPANAPLSSVLPPRVIASNPGLANQSVATLKRNMLFQYGGGPVDFGQGGGSAAGAPGGNAGGYGGAAGGSGGGAGTQTIDSQSCARHQSRHYV